jgi:hypothetical protein
MNPDDYLKMMESMSRALESVNTPSMHTAIESVSKAIVEQARQAAAIQFRFTLPPDYMDALKRAHLAFDGRFDMDRLKLLGMESDRFARELSSQQTAIDDLLQGMHVSSEVSYRLNEKVLSSLAPAEALLSSKRLNEMLIGFAVAPQRAFQEFARQQLELASKASELVRQNRFALVEAAADLLPSMSSGLEYGTLMSPSLARLATRQSGVNVFSELAIDLEDSTREEKTSLIVTAVADSRPGQAANLGARIAELVFFINTEAEREGEPPVFKPTSKSQYACCLIPTTVATDELSFCNLVDYLFFLLYEGSGEAKRITGRWGGDKLGPLWILKNLRKSARHDLDHGEEKKIIEKNKAIGDAYKELIGKAMPRSREEWAEAQVSLYTHLVDMLEALYENGV